MVFPCFKHAFEAEQGVAAMKLLASAAAARVVELLPEERLSRSRHGVLGTGADLLESQPS